MNTYRLTTKVATYIGAAGDDLFIATADALVPGDIIIGGAGTNTLALTGAGTFKLAAFWQIRNIQIVTAQEGQDAYASSDGSINLPSLRQTLYLRDGWDVEVNVANATLDPHNPTSGGITIYGARNADVIRLGTGNDTVQLGDSREQVYGGGGNNLYRVNATTIGATLDGGTGATTLAVTGGGTVRMGANITRIAQVTLQDAPSGQTQPAYNFIANAITGLTIVASSGDDAITVGNASQQVIAGPGNDTVLTTASTAGALIQGGAHTTIDTAGGGSAALNVATDRVTVMLQQPTNLTLGQGSNVSVIGSLGADTIVAMAAGQVITSLSGQDTLTGYAGGGDTFKGTAAGLSGDTIANFAAPGDTIDITDLTPGQASSYSGGATRGVLTLTDGTHSARINLTGVFAASGFQAAPDGGTGTRVTYTVPSVPLTLTAALSDDTGKSANDGITSDPKVGGTVSSAFGLAALTASVDGSAASDVLADLTATGRFTINARQEQALAGRTLADGPHRLHLVATDIAGNTVTRNVDFTLATAPPSLTAALAHDTGTSSTDGITSDDSITGTLSNAFAIASFTESVDGGAATNVLGRLNGGAFSLTPTLLTVADGSHTVKLTATDIAGNTSSDTVGFTLATAPPVLTAALANPSNPSDDTISGAAIDPVGIAALTASVDSGTAQRMLTDLQPDGSFTLRPSELQAIAGSPLANGPHVVTISATDSADNAATANVAFTLQAGSPPPLAFDLAASDQTGSAGAHQTQSGLVSLVGRTGANDTVKLLSTGATTVASNTGTFQLANVALTLGTNSLAVQAADAFGNTSKASETITRLAAPPTPDPVLQWNQITLNAITLDADAPTVASRALAMESLAVYDAIAAIDATPGYLVNLTAPSDASAAAAVAEAADQMLDYLYPAQAASFNAQLATSLAAIPDGQGKTDGTALGQQAAQKIIALRANDGSGVTAIDNGGSGVGQWQPTAPMFATAVTPQWANVTPFVLNSPNQFLPSSPPDPTSAAYATAVNQTQSLGAANSTTRTADETQIAKFWNDQAGTYTPAGQWNAIADAIAQSQGDGMASDARLLAELNVAEADSAIASWNVKYTYNAWRPITAIRNANEIGNSGLTQDASWTPLITTPAFPEYVAGHPAFSEAAAQILDSTFGNNFAFTATSASLPGVTRSFSSFDQAAQEAGESRVYGGIHFQFSVDAGLTLGQQVGDWVLQAFNLSQDTVAPKVVLDQASSLVTNTDPTISGEVTDNLSGVASLTASLDGGRAVAVALNSDSMFAVPISLATDGTADGAHTLNFVATDAAGNVASSMVFSFTLDTMAPTISLAADSIQDGGTLAAGAVFDGTITTESGVALNALAYVFDGGMSVPVAFDASTGAFDQALDLTHVGTGAHTLTLTATDAAGNITSDTLHVSLPAPPPLTITDLTPMMGASDVGVTNRPKVVFSRAVDPTTLTATSFYATDTTGETIPATILPFGDNTGAWLLFSNPMPGASTITLHVQGGQIKGLADGALLDAAGSGTPGSDLTETFTTVSTAPVPNTTIAGIVVDPGPDNTPMTQDDVKAAPDGLSDFAGDKWKLPIDGVRVYILGHEDQAVYTAADGSFTLSNAPVGDVKVVFDGSTSHKPNGFYFPLMTMDLTNVRPGINNTIMGSMGTPAEQQANTTDPAVYLPRVATDILTPISNTVPTVITAPPDADTSAGSFSLTPQQLSALSLTVQPGSLVDANGNPVANPQVGISPVPPSLVQDMLPTGLLQHTFDITIQAPGGAVFTQPANLTMPNVFGLAAGERTFILSFDHTTGRLVIDGTATVAPDGETVTTDPGTGVTQPGWHGATPPGSMTNSPAPRRENHVAITPITFRPVEGAIFNNLVAGFVYPNSAASPENFRTEIDWGDGKPTSAGTTTRPSGQAGAPFAVTGKHQYKEEGTYRVHVTVHDINQNVDTFGPEVKIVVADAPLTGQKEDIAPIDNPTEGNETEDDLKLATFKDADPDGTLKDYTANIDWGDNTKPSSGEIKSNNQGGYTISAKHAYIEEGSYTATITIADASTSTTVKNQIEVEDGKLTAKGVDFSTKEAEPFSGVVGTLTDENPKAEVLDFLASIDWGDQTTSAGLVVFAGSAGLALNASGKLFAIGGFFDRNDQSNHDTGVPSLYSAQTGAQANLQFTTKLGLSIRGGLAFDFDNQLLYALSTNSAGALTLNQIDANNTITSLFSLGTGFGGGLAFDSDDHLLYFISQNDAGEATLNSIHPDHTITSLFGLGSALFFSGLTYSTADRCFYAIANGRDGNSTLDRVTQSGAVTPLFVLGPGFTGGLAVDSNNTFYSIQGGSDGSGTLYQISLGGAVAALSDAGMEFTEGFDIIGLTHIYAGTGSRPVTISVKDAGGSAITALSNSNVTSGTAGKTAAPIVLDAPSPRSSTHQAITDGFTAPNGSPATRETSATPNLVVLLDQNNLGGAIVGSGSAEETDIATIKNRGAQPLVISDIYIAGSNAFTLTGIPHELPSNPIILNAGESLSFGADFHPSKLGLESATINVISNNSSNSIAQASIVGTGTTRSPDAHWGNDYVAIETPTVAGTTPLRTVSNGAGDFSFFLPPLSPYHITIFDPQTGLVANGYGTTAASGQTTDVTSNLAFGASIVPATGADGLPDDIAYVLGADPHRADNFVPGIPDITALQEGLISAPSLATTTGVIASLTLLGSAQAIVIVASLTSASQQTAYIATGNYGLAIVDVGNSQKPVLLGQMSLPGTATGIAVDTALGLAAVATGSGLQIVNVADPFKPALAQTIAADATQVQIIDGIAYANDGAALASFDLATGQRLQSLALGGTTITALAHDGATLYAIDANNKLITLDTTSGSMVAQGSIALPFGGLPGNRLFVADGVAYVGAAQSNGNGGYLTVDVSKPSAPRLIEGPDAQNIAGAAIALNGSGLGLTTQQIQVFAVGPENVVDAVNVSDPRNTGQFVTRYQLPAQPYDVAIGNGIGFIADGTAGLQVVNYLSFDTAGNAPTIQITQTPRDLDPATPGIQVTEGQTVTLGAAITDDVQVRNVEMLVNGVVANNSVSYPWDLSTILPSIAANGSDSVTLQLQATDTGGNVSLSSPILLQLVPDTAPPKLVSQNVTDGAVERSGFRAFIFDFSKPLDEATVTAATFSLLGPGSRPIAPQSIQFRHDDKEVQVTYAPLADGQYEYDMAANNIADRSAHPLGSSVLATHFTIAQFTVKWIDPNGGLWSIDSNWSTGQVPGPADEVLVDVPSGSTVTVGSPAGPVADASLEGGGTLTVDSSLAVTDKLDIVDSTLRVTNGKIQSATIINSGGAITLSSATLDKVTYQGTIDLSAPGATLSIADGLTMAGPSGTGAGMINLTGAGAAIYVSDSEIANAVINVGNIGGDSLYFDKLILGQSVTVHQVGTTTGNQNGSTVVMKKASNAKSFQLFNAGTIVADFSRVDPFAPPSFTIGDAASKSTSGLKDQGSSFVNQGTVTAANADTLDIIASVFTNSAGALLGATNGGIISIDAYNWSNSGTISENSATLNLGGNFRLGDLGTLKRNGGAVDITGVLDNTGTVLNVGSGTSLGSLAIVGGTIKNGTIRDTGLGVAAPKALSGNQVVATGATLDGVIYEGKLDLSEDSSALIIKNGINLTGLGGAGVGLVTLAKGSELDLEGDQKLDNAVISGGGFSAVNDYEGDGKSDTLTLGKSLLVEDTSDGLTIGETFANGGTIVNQGTIKANFGLGGQLLVGGITAPRFINQGTMSASNGDTLDVQVSEFTNSSLGILNASNGGTLSIITPVLSNAGTIIEDNGTLNLGGKFTLAQLGALSRTGGTVNLTGTLENTAATLGVGEGSAIGTLTLNDGAVALPTSAQFFPTITGGTVHDSGGGLRIVDGMLDGVTYQGTLDLSPASSTVVLRDGVTLTGSAGSGKGLIVLTGANSLVYAEGSETLDSATIDLGGGGASDTDIIYNVGNAPFLIKDDPVTPNSVLTLGSTLTINHTGRNAKLSSTAFGAGVVNSGMINADLNGGRFTIDPASFTNLGTIAVSQGDSVIIQPASSGPGKTFTNFSAGTLAGGTYVVGDGSTLALPDDDLVSTLAADVTLSGIGSALRSLQGGLNYVGLDATLAKIGSSGAFRLLDGRSANEAQSVVDNGRLELGGGTFATLTLTVAEAASVGGFGTIAAPIANSGSIAADGGLLRITGAMTGIGTASIASGATLEVDGAAGSGQTIGFTAGSGALEIGAPSSFMATIVGFAVGNEIDLLGTPASTVSFKSNTLTVKNGGTAVASLILSGNYSGATDFEVTSDGTGGSLLAIGSSPVNNANLWNAPVSGDWGTAGGWSFGTVPNDPNATAAISVGGTYAVTIGSGESFNIGTLTLGNPSADLAIDGTLKVSNGLLVESGTVTVAASGTIAGGRIQTKGGRLIGTGGTLDGVKLEGTLDLASTPISLASLVIKDGLTTTGASDTGPGSINLLGGNLYIQGTTTLDDATISIAGGTLFNDDRNGAAILNLGPRLTINQTGPSGFLYAGYSGKSGSGIVNAGTINAGFSGGTFNTVGTSLLNQNTITVSNGDTVDIRSSSFTNAAAGRLSVTNGSTLSIDSATWSNAGTISVAAATLYLGGSLTLMQAGSVTNADGTIDLIGALDNTGTTLKVGAGSGLTTLTLATSQRLGQLSTGTIMKGTIADAGSGLLFSGGVLDGVTYQGTLDLSPDSSTVSIKDGITLTGPGGSGPGAIKLGNHSNLQINGDATIDNATISGGTASVSSIIGTDNHILTLGPHLTINFAGGGAGGISFTDSPNGLTAGTLINKGTISASSLNGNASINFSITNFTNQGTITIANNQTVRISDRFSNAGTISLSGGTLELDPNGNEAKPNGSSYTVAELGTIKDTGGTLLLQNGVILDNTGAVLELGAGSSFGKLAAGGTIRNGTINDAGSGLLAQGGTLDGVTYHGTIDLSLPGAGVLAIKNGISLTGVGGSGPGLINLVLGSQSSQGLLFAQGTETFDNATIRIGGVGGATGTLFNDDSDGVSVLTLGAELTVNQSGSFAAISSRADKTGSGVVNSGTINAGVNGGRFTINPARFNNQGLVHVSNSDVMTISPASVTNTGLTSTSFTNAGKLWVDNGSAIVQTSADGNGSDEISGAGALEFTGGVGPGQAVTFDAGSTGTLRLDQSQGFAGTVAGLAHSGSNFLDLSDIAFGAGTKATYSGTAAGGTLHVTDGTHTANISLIGDYTGATFVAATDNHGGTLVHDPVPSSSLAPGDAAWIEVTRNTIGDPAMSFVHPMQLGGTAGGDWQIDAVVQEGESDPTASRSATNDGMPNLRDTLASGLSPSDLAFGSSPITRTAANCLDCSSVSHAHYSADLSGATSQDGILASTPDSLSRHWTTLH
jgi:hypothetical protein